MHAMNMHCWPKVGIPIALRKMGNQLPISLAKAAHSKPTCLQQSYPCDRGGSLKLPSTEWHCYTAVHFLPAVCHWLSRSSISPATRDGIWSCLHAKFLLHHRGRAESRRRPPPPPPAQPDPAQAQQQQQQEAVFPLLYTGQTPTSSWSAFAQYSRPGERVSLWSRRT